MSMKKITCFLLLTIIAGNTFSQTKIPGHSNNNTLLWEITGKGLKKPSYLFGTFHLICADNLKLSGNLKAALSSAQSLYLEMDMDDPDNTFGAMKYMMMNNDTTLSMLMNPESYQKLTRFMKDSMRTSITMIEKMKPTFATALFFPRMMSCKKVTGVETELMKLAKSDNKAIKGFETIAFQSSVFDKISYTQQASQLMEMIDSFAVTKAAFDTMMEAYLSQDLAAMEASFEKEPGFEATKDELLINRNKNWVKQLGPILKQENVFVAVGAGHLIGEEGLIKLLKKEGYKVRPLLNTD
jgi:uncharacterized protein YbaP (TraB family)